MVDQSLETNHEEEAAAPVSKGARRILLIINCLTLILGNTGGPLLLRLYYRNGGHRVWLTGWLQTGGWPILILPLLVSYIHRRSTSSGGNVKLFFMTWWLFVACTVLGLLTGVDNYIYAYGLSFLPVSTSALLIATQLVFTAFFAFLIVKQKFTAYSLNAVALLSIGAVILGLHTSSDRPEGVTKAQYYLGFFLTIACSALYGLVLPLIELTCKKVRQRVTYTLVMEMQLVIGFVATFFCTVGMIANNDFQAMAREAKNFKMGEAKYYVTVVWAAIIWNMFFLGAVGVISCASSLLAGIILAALIPVVEVLAVIFYQERFTSEKGVSLALCLWGFASYYYGEARDSRKKKKKASVENGIQLNSLSP